MIQKLVSYIGVFYLHFVGKTSFTESTDDPEYLAIRRKKTPVIYALWHNNQVYLAYAHRGEQAGIMVSMSRDGEYIAQVMKRLGLIPVRGSSSKGGDQALKQIVEILEKGGQAGFTPDGPKGPAQSVQGGLIWTAQKSGAPIVPVSVALRRKIEFKSWDRFKVPLPFNRVILVHGKPFRIPAELDAEAAKIQVKKSLNGGQDLAEDLLSRAPGWWFSLSGQAIYILYNFLSLVLSPILLLGFFFKFGLKRSLLGLAERFGRNPFPPSRKRRLWFHAASIGEWRALKPLLKEFRNKQGFEMVGTVTTPEAKKIIEREEPSFPVRFLPIDNPWLLRSWVKKLNPHGLFIIESELWPSLISVVHKLNIPIFILNGRLSEKSSKGWKNVRPLARRIMKRISFVYARTEKDKARFVRLGMTEKRILVLGNTKADNVEVFSDAMKNEKKAPYLKSWRGVVLMAVSTWPGEEELMLKALKKVSGKPVRLILAPRRQERLGEVESLLKSYSLPFQFFSEIKKGKAWEAPVVVVDTVGDLKDLFIVCDLAFVGGSVYPHGGQNPLEPAAARLALVFGPHMQNFDEETAGFLRSGGAVQGVKEDEIVKLVSDLIADDSLRSAMGEKAAVEVASQQGATKRIAEELSRHLGI